MAAKTLPVLIIGGGIGGMSLAIALAKNDIYSIVLEQSEKIREVGGGIQLCPNVFKMFAFLGLTEAVRPIAFFPENLIYIDGYSDQEVLCVPCGQRIEKRFGYPYGVFHRGELLSVLHRECQKYTQIKLVTAARFIDFAETQNTVIAKTSSGSTFEGGALVGADGLWSVVRNRLIGDGKPIASGLVTYRGVIPYSHTPAHFRTNNVYHWVKPAHLVYYQIQHGELFNVVAAFYTEDKREPDDTSGNLKELQEQYKDAPPEMLELLAMVNPQQSWMLCDRNPIAQWSKGKITLLGDAAHPTLPHLTQGAGMAIEDAVVLARHICRSRGDYTTAFEGYQKERYLRTGRVQLFSRLYKEIFHATGVAREVRNQVLANYTVDDYYNWVSWAYNGIE